jgi:hypothetical protein
MTNIAEWQEKYPNGKAPLSWDLSDYIFWNEEPPPCVILGVTEGQSIAREDVEEWAREVYQTLYILREQNPDKFDDHFNNFVLDLEYLHHLDKISKEDVLRLKDKESLNIG